MKKKNLILIGGGGHCKSCIDVIEAENKYKIIGIVDIKEKVQQKILNYKIIASDEDLPNLIKECKNFLITIGQIKNAARRIEKFNYLKNLGAKFPVIISPKSYVSKYAKVKEGTIIMHNVFINSKATIGKNCIINTSALIEHDVIIGDNCHISTASTINGECVLGEKIFVGSNSVIANNVSIAKDTIIGAGSVVIKSIAKSGIYVGNPVRKIK